MHKLFKNLYFCYSQIWMKFFLWMMIAHFLKCIAKSKELTLPQDVCCCIPYFVTNPSSIEMYFWEPNI
jgi:hypothetical protein